MVHGFKIIVSGHSHVQSKNGHAGFFGNNGSRRCAAVGLYKDSGEVMLPYQADQVDQLLGGSLAAGFFLYSFQNGQIKAFCQIRKPVVKGNDLPAVKVCLSLLAVGLQGIQISFQNSQICLINIRILGIFSA